MTLSNIDSAQARSYHTQLITELRTIGSVEGGFNRKRRMSMLRDAASYRRIYARERAWEKVPMVMYAQDHGVFA